LKRQDHYRTGRAFDDGNHFWDAFSLHRNVVDAHDNVARSDLLAQISWSVGQHFSHHHVPTAFGGLKRDTNTCGCGFAWSPRASLYGHSPQGTDKLKRLFCCGNRM